MRGLPWMLPCAVAAALAAAHPSPALRREAPASPPADTGLQGEAGLWVEVAPDSVTVHWITDPQAPARIFVQTPRGFLGFLLGPHTLLDATLPGSSDGVHQARFRNPGAKRLSVRYGASGPAPEEPRSIELDLADLERRPPVEEEGGARMYVVGDVHGEYDRLVGLLRQVGIVDAQDHWSAASSRLVFVGDLVDRGPEAMRVLWLVYRLEREARDQGGAVHVILGNHEIMDMTGDLRYVHPQGEELAARYDVSYARLLDPRVSFLGRWLATKPPVIRIDGVLFAHGGVTPRYATVPLTALRDSVRAFLPEELTVRWFDSTYVAPMDSSAVRRRNDFYWGDESPLWYRGYVQTDTAGAALDTVLSTLGATVHVVGHTPIPHIEARYGGRLVAVNTTLFADELLEMDDGGSATVHRLGQAPAPLTPDGG